jgi:LmbE family N-acetylglucosaminyl deacetylase
MANSRRFLMIGAHPDDADIRFGGTAIQLAKAGHTVKFVSMSNGDCGHRLMHGKELAERRWHETQKAAAIFGIAEYQVMDHHDCELEATVENRKEVIRLIRQFRPDVVLSHRTCDYHADHRACAQLVQDAAYLVMVPQFCPETPIPEANPIFGCVFDAFTDPRPARPDAAVAIDAVHDQKNRALDCHVSQFYEWLAEEHGYHGVDFSSWCWEEKSAYLTKHWGLRFKVAADAARQTLKETYGDEAGSKVQFAEVFELSPYGRKVTLEEFRNLLLGKA